MQIDDITMGSYGVDLSDEVKGKLRRYAHDIAEHNRIHQEKEPQAVFISEALDIVSDLLRKIADEEVSLVGNTVNEATVAHCDEYICKRCGTYLEGWSRVEIDDDFLDRTYYEYEFSFCPECGAKIQEGVI